MSRHVHDKNWGLPMTRVNSNTHTTQSHHDLEDKGDIFRYGRSHDEVGQEIIGQSLGITYERPIMKVPLTWIQMEL